MGRVVVKLIYLGFLLTSALAFSANKSGSYTAKPETIPRSSSVSTNPQQVTQPNKANEVMNRFAENISGTMALTSNYVFRGLTQTENLPAVQGSVTYTIPIGLYATLWSSNNKFIDTNINLELDPGIGFKKEIGKDFSFDIVLYRYIFPSMRDWDYNEWIGLVNYKFLQADMGYSGNVYNVKRKGLYYDGGINYAIPKKYLFGIDGVSFLALAGRYELPKDFPDEAGISYNTYTLSISKEFKQYSLVLQYTNTTEREFYQWYGGDKLVCTLAANF